MTRIEVLMLCAFAHSARAAERPNIIFVFTDDFGWGDLGSYGGNMVATPHLDRMAAEGVRFSQFYVASPICSPSRTGAMTGMFPARWRITSYLQDRKGNAACGQADFLDAGAPGVARLLQASGYATRISASGTWAAVATSRTRRTSKRMASTNGRALGKVPILIPT